MFGQRERKTTGAKTGKRQSPPTPQTGKEEKKEVRQRHFSMKPTLREKK